MNYEFLSRTFLFQGTSPEETKHMLSCLKATPQSYAKGSTIWQVGDQVKTMGLVLNGSVHPEVWPYPRSFHRLLWHLYSRYIRQFVHTESKTCSVP